MNKSLVKSKAILLSLQIAAVVGLLGYIEYLVSSGKVGQLYLASPSQIMEAYREMFVTHAIFPHLWTTLQEAMIGFAIALVAGVFFGILIATIEVLERFINPFMAALMAVPKVAIIPMLIIWFGIGLLNKVVLVFMFCFFHIMYNTISGIKQTHENYLKVARVFEASRLQTTFKILLPSALPTLFASIRVGVATALLGALFAEMLASKQGLGHLLSQYSSLYDTPKTFAIIILVTVISVLLVQLVDVLEKKVFLKWRE